MPVLTPPATALVKNARFTAADFNNLHQAFKKQRATLEDLKAIATRYTDTLEPGVGNWFKGLLKANNVTLNFPEPIRNLAEETSLLMGQITLPDSGRRHPSVKFVQRALIALASRTQVMDYMLVQFGADGDYGEETVKAVKAFQQFNALPVTGKVDATTARALDAALRQTQAPGAFNPTATDIVAAALELCQEPVALNYGVPHPWINTDPMHNVPAERPFMPLVNRWKCNLYGGNVLRKAGFEPPYFGNQGKGEYPNANQWFKWSDTYASRFSNKVHFQLIDEIKYTELPIAEHDSRTRRFLSKVQLGDYVLADHLGEEVQDGGHTRVAVSLHADGTVGFAQARQEQSLVEIETVIDFTSEERIWLMRPNRKM
jgi:hypothetical protein